MARKKRRQFPLTIEIEWPDGPLAHPRSRRLIFGGSAVLIVLLISGALVWMLKGKTPAASTAVVHVASDPVAVAYLDGNKQAATPIDLLLASGAHELSVRRDDYLPRTTYLSLREGERAVIDVPLWLRQPPLRPLKAPFPGAALSDANFSVSGQIALTVALPDGQQQLCYYYYYWWWPLLPLLPLLPPPLRPPHPHATAGRQGCRLARFARE